MTQSIWNDSTGNHLWSNAANWTPNGVITGNVALFSNATLTQSTVDQSMTIAGLQFRQNSAIPHVVTIGAGTTLTVEGNVAFGDTTAGTGANSTNTYVTMTGGGSLVVNNVGGSFRLGDGTNTGRQPSISVDLAGLSNLQVNLGATGQFLTGVGDNAASRETILKLAQNNTISAGTLTIGQSALGNLNEFWLGTGTNVLNVNTLNLGTGSRDRGFLKFAGPTGTLTIGGFEPGSRANLNIATGTANTGNTGMGTVFDTRGHQADLMLGAVTIGTQPRAIDYSTNFLFDQGTIDMDTLTLGIRGINTSGNGSGSARDTTVNFEIGGGSVVINQGILAMGRVTGTNYGSGNDIAKDRNVTAVIKLYGDAVMDVHAAANGIAISMAGAESPSTGTGMENAFASIYITEDSKLTVHGDIMKEGGGDTTFAGIFLEGDGHLDMTGHSITLDLLDITSGTLSNLGEFYHGDLATGTQIVADVVKRTDGTLILEGSNTYTGKTIIQNGTVQVGTGGTTGSIGSGDIELQAANSLLIFNSDQRHEINQDISGLGAVEIHNGRIILNGNNSYTGMTRIDNGGILELQDSAALAGTLGVQVKTGGSIEYLGNGDLGLNKILQLENGSSVGMSMGGAFSTTANVVASGNVNLNLYQIAGQTVTPGTITLLSAAGGGVSGAVYKLTLFNVSDYTVSNLTTSSTAVTADITATAAAGLLVWQGGKVSAPYQESWAVAEYGTFISTSNWGVYNFDGENELAPTQTVLVPGEDTHVLITRKWSGHLDPDMNMNLQADMSVGSVWFRSGDDGDAANPANFNLIDPNYTLTVGTYFDSNPDFNYTIRTQDTGKVLIDISKLILRDAGSTFLVSGSGANEELEIRSVIDGNSFIKNGAGRLVLSGDESNTFVGTVEMNEGEMVLNKAAGKDAISGDLNINAGTVLLMNDEQIADSAVVTIANGAFLVLNGHNESIDQLSGTGVVRSGVEGTATLTIGVNNGSSVFDGVIENGGGSPILLALTKVGSGTLRLNGKNTYGGLTSVLGGTLQYGTDDVIASGAVTVDGGILDLNGYKDTVGVITLDNGGQIIGEGSVLTSGSTRQFRDGTVSVTLAGSGGITKTTNGLVVLKGDNTFTGNVSVNGGGILRLESDTALGSTKGTTTIQGNSDNGGRIELVGGITIGERLTIAARQGVTADAVALSNLSGNNIWSGDITLTTGGTYYNIESQADLFHIIGNMAGNNDTSGTGRHIQLMGAGDGIISGVIANGPNATASFRLTKKGTGTWTLAGANTYSGLTIVEQGTLRLTNSKALQNSSGLEVRNGANLIFNSGEVGNLTLSGLQLAGAHRLGVEVGNAIAATGAATTVAGSSIVLDIYGLSGFDYVTGTQYDVITGGAGSSLNNANYTLGNFYNLTNFTVDSVGKETNRVYLNLVAVAPEDLPTELYWKGGYTGGSNVWAISNGLSSGGLSNWTKDQAGTENTALVPGENTRVIFSADNPTNAADPMVLGASMSVAGITFRSSNEVHLYDYNNTLTFIDADAIILQGTAGLVTLNTNLIFDHASTVIDIDTDKELRIGAVHGVNGFTKTGAGTLRFVQGGSSTHTGTVRIHEGLAIFERGFGANAVSGGLEIGSTSGSLATVLLADHEQIADDTDVLINSGGVLDLNGRDETLGALSGTGSIVSATEVESELSVGGGNGSAVFDGTITETSGILGLRKVGTGVQSFSKALSYSGITRVDNGELRLLTGASIGVAGSSAGGFQVGIANGAQFAKFVAEAGSELRVGNGAEDNFEVGRGALNYENSNAAGRGDVDLSASDNFTANVGRFLVGVENENNNAESHGIVKLAKNNQITVATDFTVGHSPNYGNINVTSSVTFGSGLSVVQTPLMYVGRRKSNALVDIEQGGVLNLNNGSGSNTVLRVGYFDASSANATQAVMDMRGGTFIATLDSLNIGYKVSGNTGSVDAAMYLGESENNDVVVVNALEIGRLEGAASGAGTTKGLLRIEGGNLNAGSAITIGRFSGSNGNVEGRLEILGGKVTMTNAGDITTTNSSRSSSVVQLDGGELDMNLGQINVDQFLAQSGTLSNVGGIYNGAGTGNNANLMALSKTTQGVLRMTGNNSYGGATNVDEGTLLVNGSNTLGSDYTVAANAVLGGTGLIEPAAGSSVVIQSQGKLAVGDNSLEAAHLAITTSGAGALKFETNSSLEFDLFGGGQGSIIEDGYSDQLDITGALNVGQNVQLIVNTTADVENLWNVGDTWQLINWADLAVANNRQNDFVFVDLTDLSQYNMTWDLSDLYVGGTISIVLVPEPARGLLMVTGLMWVLLRRRRASRL